jgi:hypothetical protein
MYVEMKFLLPTRSLQDFYRAIFSIAESWLVEDLEMIWP